MRIDGTPVIKVILLLSTYSRQVLGLKLRIITIHPPTYKVGVGPPECKPPRWNHGVIFIVMSVGLSGKCIITSCAESTSFTLLSGTPFGVPVVPEVCKRTTSSYICGSKSTGGFSSEAFLI